MKHLLLASLFVLGASWLEKVARKSQGGAILVAAAGIAAMVLISIW